MPDRTKPLAPRRGKRSEPGRSSARLGADQAPQPRPGWGRLVWIKMPAAILVVGSIWILHLFFHDARFRVNEVTIEGARLVSSEQIAQTLGLEQMCTFRVNSAQLAAQLQSAFPIITQAEVHSELPDKVTIQVKEVAEVLLWESGGRTWWVDSQGKVLGEVQAPVGLVAVHDLEGIAPDPGEHIASVPWALAWEMVQAMPAIRMFDYSVEKGLIVYVTPSQWPVYLGDTGDGREKLAIMSALAQQLVETNASVEYIDLRNERRPVFKRR